MEQNKQTNKQTYMQDESASAVWVGHAR